ncbi:hypothetical protein Ahy_A05g022979 isoform F [Arachis hypogaea]|uniref:Uncharacterized protein n=1 Tax=Arachis hypogaea TaxID=3818 RepID=A0A445D236_ARAHY|nr:hypothetical protein Ahy_A05g022979 isoform F [Arachis hypogaea]
MPVRERCCICQGFDAATSPQRSSGVIGPLRDSDAADDCSCLSCHHNRLASVAAAGTSPSTPSLAQQPESATSIGDRVLQLERNVSASAAFATA